MSAVSQCVRLCVSMSLRPCVFVSTASEFLCVSVSLCLVSVSCWFSCGQGAERGHPSPITFLASGPRLRRRLNGGCLSGVRMRCIFFGGTKRKHVAVLGSSHSFETSRVSVATRGKPGREKKSLPTQREVPASKSVRVRLVVSEGAPASQWNATRGATP